MDSLSWTSLLGQWMDFAKASLVIPDEADGDRWRACVVDVITLQALTKALAELDRLESADRSVARDRAAIMISEHGEHLRKVWSGVDQPVPLKEIAEDVAIAYERSAYCGARELVWDGADTMVMPPVDVPAEAESVAVMQPGTIVMPCEPVAWWIGERGVSIEGGDVREVEVPRQVYRQVDERGRIVRDVLAEVTGDCPPGLPLLVPLRWQGEAIGHFTMDAEAWETRQRGAMVGEMIEVTTI